MVWVYESTGSLLVAMLMHASLDFFWLISTPRGITTVPQLTWYLAWTALLWVVVASVVLSNRRQFAQPPLTEAQSSPKPGVKQVA